MLPGRVEHPLCKAAPTPQNSPVHYTHTKYTLICLTLDVENLPLADSTNRAAPRAVDEKRYFGLCMQIVSGARIRGSARTGEQWLRQTRVSYDPRAQNSTAS